MLPTLNHISEKLRFLRDHRRRNGKKELLKECTNVAASHPSSDIYSIWNGRHNGVKPIHLRYNELYSIMLVVCPCLTDKQEHMEAKKTVHGCDISTYTWARMVVPQEVASLYPTNKAKRDFLWNTFCLLKSATLGVGSRGPSGPTPIYAGTAWSQHSFLHSGLCSPPCLFTAL